MSDQTLNLTVALVADETSVTLGDGKRADNRVTIRLTNDSDQPVSIGSAFGSRGAFKLGFSVGSAAEDLVHSLEESVDLTIEGPQDWKLQPYTKVKNRALYEFRLPKQVFRPGESKTVVLKDFLCRAAPGKARLEPSFKISGYGPVSQPLEVEKRADVFDLLYFEANPPYITTDEEKRGFSLSWSTLRAGTAVLKRDRRELASFTAGQDGFENGTGFVYRLDQPDLETTIYELTATHESDPHQSRSIEQRVHVLQPGWYAVEFRRYGYPAVLCSLDDEVLYGIFIDQGRARLCSSRHPVAVWNLVKDQVPGGMATSAAVGFNSRVWLLGGSSVDTDVCSNQVHAYDPGKGEWTEQDRPPWQPRMGHACLVYGEELWVMGGLDGDGNALRDLYSLDRQGRWTRHDDAPWAPRCMLAAAGYRGRLWIYGGCAEPFGDPRADMWTFARATGWVRHTDLPSLPSDSLSRPISNDLRVVGDRLYLLGSFRSGQTVRAQQCLWNEEQKSWFVEEVTRPWDQQGQNTHSLSGAAFKGLVYLRSLNWRTDDNPTKLYMLKP